MDDNNTKTTTRGSGRAIGSPRDAVAAATSIAMDAAAAAAIRRHADGPPRGLPADDVDGSEQFRQLIAGDIRARGIAEFEAAIREVGEMLAHVKIARDAVRNGRHLLDAHMSPGEVSDVVTECDGLAVKLQRVQDDLCASVGALKSEQRRGAP